MQTAKHKRLIDIETRYCLQCRYPLRGLSEHRCPECGKRFDPADPKTTAGKPQRSYRPGSLVLLAHLLPLVTLVLALTFLNSRHWAWRWSEFQDYAPLLLVVTCVVAATLPRPFAIRSRLACLTPLLFAFALYFIHIMYGQYHSRPSNLVSDFLLRGISLLPLLILTGLTSWSMIATKRYVQSLNSSLRYRATFAFLLWIVTMFSLSWILAEHWVRHEFVDYWSYWFWKPQRW